VEWEHTVHRLVAQYRQAMADHVGEPAWRGLIARLSEASPEFVRVWDERQVLGPENQTKLIMNEKVGLLRLESMHHWLGPRPWPQGRRLHSGRQRQPRAVGEAGSRPLTPPLAARPALRQTQATLMAETAVPSLVGLLATIPRRAGRLPLQNVPYVWPNRVPTRVRR